MSLLGDYSPGESWLHRWPAGRKLLALALAGVVVLVLRGPVVALLGLLVAAVVLVSTRTGGRAALRALRRVLLVASLLGAVTAWQSGPGRAVETVADLLALVLLATALTLTTPIDEVLDTLTRALAPLRPLGVRPEAVALTFSLALRAVPLTVRISEEARDAALSRGLERDPRARLVPLVIRVVAHARATGEALAARGIGDE